MLLAASTTAGAQDWQSAYDANILYGTYGSEYNTDPYERNEAPRPPMYPQWPMPTTIIRGNGDIEMITIMPSPQYLSDDLLRPLDMGLGLPWSIR
jgi:hypothetical protein